jgi:hypothetical protein
LQKEFEQQTQVVSSDLHFKSLAILLVEADKKARNFLIAEEMTIAWENFIGSV